MVAPQQYKRSVVRRGPLCIGLAMLFVIPLVITSVLNTRLERKTTSSVDHWGPRRTQGIGMNNALSWSNKGSCPKYDSVQVIVTDERREVWWFPTTTAGEEAEIGDNNQLLDVWKATVIRSKDTPIDVAERLISTIMTIESPGSLPRESSSTHPKDLVAATEMSDEPWTFLGKTPNSSSGCTSSLYSYTVIHRSGTPFPSSAFSLSKVQVWQKIQANHMASVSALATVSLALANVSRTSGVEGAVKA